MDIRQAIMKKPSILKGTMLLIIAGLMTMASGTWAADSVLLNLRELTPPEKTRLSKESLREYERGLQSLDKINNEAAFKHFQKAVELDPKHIHLRFLLVQLAHYLGDLSMDDDSVKYYDLAATNLSEILKSPKLNKREKERAEKSLELTQKLRQSVVERDQNRMKYGLELAKLYAKDIYKPEEKPEPVRPGGLVQGPPPEVGKTETIDTNVNETPTPDLPKTVTIDQDSR